MEIRIVWERARPLLDFFLSAYPNPGPGVRGCCADTACTSTLPSHNGNQNRLGAGAPAPGHTSLLQNWPGSRTRRRAAGTRRLWPRPHAHSADVVKGTTLKPVTLLVSRATHTSCHRFPPPTPLPCWVGACRGLRGRGRAGAEIRHEACDGQIEIKERDVRRGRQLYLGELRRAHDARGCHRHPGRGGGHGRGESEDKGVLLRRESELVLGAGRPGPGAAYIPAGSRACRRRARVGGSPKKSHKARTQCARGGPRGQSDACAGRADSARDRDVCVRGGGVRAWTAAAAAARAAPRSAVPQP